MKLILIWKVLSRAGRHLYFVLCVIIAVANAGCWRKKHDLLAVAPTFSMFSAKLGLGEALLAEKRCFVGEIANFSHDFRQ